MRFPPAQPVRYPNVYSWLVFVAALDLMVTYLVLYIGGYEANALASWVLDAYGFRGMVLYKFGLVLFLVVLCELIGGRDKACGRAMGVFAVGISCLPVAFGMLLLAAKMHHFA